MEDNIDQVRAESGWQKNDDLCLIHGSLELQITNEGTFFMPARETLWRRIPYRLHLPLSSHLE